MFKRILTPLIQAMPREYWTKIWAIYQLPRILHRLLWQTGYIKSALKGEPVGPDGQRLPWLTYPALAWLTSLDVSQKTVFEFGGGCSSVWFGKHAKSVKTVESDAYWAGHIRELCPATAVILCEDEYSYASAIGTGGHDIVLIDGKWREACARACLKTDQPNGMIIVDNADVIRGGKEAATVLENAGLLRVDFWGFASNALYGCTSVFFNVK